MIFMGIMGSTQGVKLSNKPPNAAVISSKVDKITIEIIGFKAKLLGEVFNGAFKSIATVPDALQRLGCSN